MIRIVALLVTLFAAALAILANGQSSSDAPDSFDIEPPPLRQNLSNRALPSISAQNLDISRLEKQLEHAKANAEGAERLCKIGVLSKMEAEQRSLKVVRCEADLASARLARAKEELAVQKSRVVIDENSKQELEAAKATVAQLTEAAQLAAAKRARAELEAAEANLRRQQKLLKLGTARKSDVDRAAQKLAELKEAER